jgi:hypothetical protein
MSNADKNDFLLVLSKKAEVGDQHKHHMKARQNGVWQRQRIVRAICCSTIL